MNSEGRLRGDFLLRVPELTRSVGIQLNERVSLRRPCELLTLSQSRGLADAASSAAMSTARLGVAAA
jgi:hypothetical protein